MIRTVLLALLLACGRSQSVSDQELGGLVVAQKATDAKIDVDRAAKDPDELTRALMRPFRAAVATLGPHTLAIASQTLTDEGGAHVEDLADKVSIETGPDGAWRGVYTNSADYGRETIYIASGGSKQLYLRPRYQRWHQRAPESPEEPDQLRDAYAEVVGATWELLAPGAELTDGGTVQVAGRTGRKIVIKQAPQPRALPAEPLAQRAWRAHRTIEQVQGEVVLDADTGVPLHVELAGAVGFSREGKRYTMKLGVSSEVTVGASAAIAAPAQGEVVATPERQREVDDRDLLLQGMAPPLRKTADGTATPAKKPESPAPDAPAKPTPAKPKPKADP